MTFNEFFKIATGKPGPYPYQERLAKRHVDFLRVETGLGKTEGLALGWLWRLINDPATTPRRLIYVLPMRSLVEQTVARVKDCVDRLREHGIEGLPDVEAVIGGDIGENWYQNPENPWIVVGTQDALLSRALNRGYAMSRFKWPMTFGAINNDVYWVIDEVQLQGIGAVTATQLQALRDRFGTHGPTNTTLASATLDKAWFETADYDPYVHTEETLQADDLDLESVRKISFAQKKLARVEVASEKEIADAVVASHRPGTRTLVILNTVERAKEVLRRLKRGSTEAELILLHSRFRPVDRKAHIERLRFEPDTNGPGAIVIATQVIEAGVDVTSATLFTDTAPWSSLVQRFGRCNRRGDDENARVVWIDSGEPTAKNSLPYETEELLRAREVLISLVGCDLAPSKLPKTPIERGGGLVLRSPDLLDLFDTSTDLAGHDVDVSPYIRDAQDFTVTVFWREEPPTDDAPPRREELCPVAIGDMRTLVKELRAAGRAVDVRIANQFGHAHQDWTPLIAEAIRPGLLVWLRGSVGKYDSEIGFDKDARQLVPAVPNEHPPSAFVEECATIEGDRESQIGVAQTITTHAQWTHWKALCILESLSLGAETQKSVAEAALWHDVGKAHAVFQKALRDGTPADFAPGEPIAKSVGRGSRYSRRGFRHELPGALVYLAAHDGEASADLIAFLIAAHHGKFRVSAVPLPYEKGSEAIQVLGNREGDQIPQVALLEGVTSPQIAVSLVPFRIGSENGSPTWVERVTRLRDNAEQGPFRLAFLELLVRVADWRASRDAAEGKNAPT